MPLDPFLLVILITCALAVAAALLTWVRQRLRHCLRPPCYGPSNSECRCRCRRCHASYLDFHRRLRIGG